jgi:hypothetical protein
MSQSRHAPPPPAPPSPPPSPPCLNLYLLLLLLLLRRRRRRRTSSWATDNHGSARTVEGYTIITLETYAPPSGIFLLEHG